MSDESLDRIEFVLKQKMLPAGSNFTHRERLLFVCHYLNCRIFRPRNIPVELAKKAGYASPVNFHGSLSAAYSNGRIADILEKVENGLYGFKDDFLREAGVEIKTDALSDDGNHSSQAITIQSLLEQLTDDQKVALLLINDFSKEILSNGVVHLRISLGHLPLSTDENEELFQLLQAAHVLESSGPGVIDVMKTRFEELIALIQSEQEQDLVNFADSMKSDEEYEAELKQLCKTIAQLSEVEKQHRETAEQFASDMKRRKDQIVMLEREIADFRRLAVIAQNEQEKIRTQIISLSREKDEILEELENRRLSAVEKHVKEFAVSLGMSKEALLRRMLYRSQKKS